MGKAVIVAVNATITSATKDGTCAYLSVSVPNDTALPGGAPAAVEYSAQTPLNNPDGSAKPQSQLKSELVALCKAQRDAQKAQRQDAGITGAVQL